MGYFASQMRKMLFPSWILLLLLLSSCQEQDMRSRGQKSMELGDYARARQAWSALLDQNPADANARRGLAMTLFAEARSKEEQMLDASSLWDSCTAEFQILLRLDSSVTIRGMASTALFHQAHGLVEKEQHGRARKSLQHALALDSLNGFAWNLLGLAWEDAGDTAKARLAYERGISFQSSLVACYVNLGNLHWRAGRSKDAWEFWSLGLEQDSTNSYLRYWRDRALQNLEEKALGD